MNLYVWDEVVLTTPEALEQAARKISDIAGARIRSSVSTVVRTYVRPPETREDWTRVRSRNDRRSYGGGPLGLIWHLAWSDRWTKAGGPFMQTAALLRANASGVGHPQRELQEKRP